MLSPAHSSSSSNEGREHNILEPRSVADFMMNFRRALTHQFYIEDPGRAEVFRLVGDFVGPNNKRRCVFYVAHGPIETARRLTRIDYTMPAGPISAVLLFGGGGRETLPATGPDFTTIDVPEGSTAVAAVTAAIAATAAGPPAQRLAPWGLEIDRVASLRDNPAEPSVRRQAASNIVQFWQDMRGQIMEALFVHVQRPGAAVLASPPPSPPSPPAAPPAAPVATSSSERRRRTARRNRNAAATAVRNRNVRRANSDPADPYGYIRDPVTGKLTRQRRPNSDPK